jgi:hypothetical protein
MCGSRQIYACDVSSPEGTARPILEKWNEVWEQADLYLRSERSTGNKEAYA